MTVDEYLALSCSRKALNPMEHFVRVKKRRDMEDHNYFVPHRTDSIETYVSISFESTMIITMIKLCYTFTAYFYLYNTFFLYVVAYARSC